MGAKKETKGPFPEIPLKVFLGRVRFSHIKMPVELFETKITGLSKNASEALEEAFMFFVGTLSTLEQKGLLEASEGFVMAILS